MLKELNGVKKFLSFNIIFNCIFISLLYSGVPHAVVGTIQYVDESFPSQVSWKAFITTRATDTLDKGPPSLYDS